MFAGHFLLFGRAGSLFAQPFDPVRFEFSGSPLPVAQSIGFNQPEAYVPVSAQSAVLVYDSWGAAAQNRLAWFDRSGKILGMLGEAALYSQPQLAPDGRLAAETREDPPSGATDVWLDYLTRGVASRFTFDQNSRNPVWSPDGTRIAYSSVRQRSGAALYLKSSNGAAKEEMLLPPAGRPQLPTDWSRDGRFLLYQALDPRTGWDVWVLPLAGDRRPVLPFLQTPFSEQDGVFSPDGNWIAYDSDESGRPEVYVQAFSQAGARLQGKWQISSSGGSHPRWSRDGREIFFMAPDGITVAVSVDPANLRPGSPRPLFPVRGADPHAGFDVTPDGRRFLIPISENEQASAPATVLLNWTSALRQ